MVVAAAGRRRRRVTCWTTFLCSCGGWCRVGGGGQGRIIIALQAIMNGLLFGRFAVSASLCHNCSLTERNGGTEKWTTVGDKEDGWRKRWEHDVRFKELNTSDGKWEEKVMSRFYICASDSDAGGCEISECSGGDEDGDDGDMDNGGIHVVTPWRFCPSVIHASTLFSHAFKLAVRLTHISSPCNTEKINH